MVITKTTRPSTNIELQNNSIVSHLEPKSQPITKTETSPPVIRTIKEAENLSKRTVSSMLGDGRKFFDVGAAVLNAAAAATNFLPEGHFVRKTLMIWAAASAKLGNSVSDATGAIDAIKSGRPFQAAAQIGNTVTFLPSPIQDMITNQGLFMGLGTALPALETLHGKVTYTNFQDYLMTNWGAFKSILTKFSKNPMSLFDLKDKASLGVFSGIARSLSTLLYKLTGLKFFATTSDVFAMTGAMEQVKPIHLEAGRGRYAAAGWLRMASSAANIMSQYSKSKTGLAFYAAQILNAFSNDRFQAALRSNEPAKNNSSISFVDMLKTSIKYMFTFGRETKEVLRRAQPLLLKVKDQSPIVQKQVQAVTKNGMSSNLGSTSRAKTNVSARMRETVVPVNRAAAVETKATPVKVETKTTTIHRIPNLPPRESATGRYVPRKASEVNINASSSNTSQLSAQGGNSFSRPVSASFDRFAAIPTKEHKYTPTPLPSNKGPASKQPFAQPANKL